MAEGMEQAQGQGQGEGGMMEGVQALGDGLKQLQDGITKSGAPKELLAPLQASVQAFDEFMSLLTGGGQQPVQGTADQAAAGNTNAVPA